MRILLTGANGQLGYELQRWLAPLGSLVTDRGGSVSLHSVATSGIQRYADAAVQLSGDFSVTHFRGSLASALRGLLPPSVITTVAEGDTIPESLTGG